MMTTIYLHPEDDIAKVAARLQEVIEDEVLLVFPKKSYLFSDSINLRLLKKQVDLLQKRVFIFTMDETGQNYAKEAGFELKFLTPQKRSAGSMDVRKTTRVATVKKETAPDVTEDAPAPRPVVKKKILAQKPKPVLSTTKALPPAPEEELLPAPVQSTPVALKKPITKTKVQTAPVVSTVNDTDFSQLTDLSPEQPPTMFGDMLNHYEEHDQPVIEPRKYRKLILGFIALALIMILVLVLLVLPKASVVVYAKTKPVIRDVEVGVAASLTMPDSDKLTMPALELNQTLKGTKTFTSTGKKEVGSKAEGTVVIYNLTGGALNLRESTTTLSIGGKNYYFAKDQNGIPVVKNGQDATYTADIVAEQGGEDYNVPAGTRLEITNKVFGGKPQLLYAKTATALIGGNSRFISYVTEQDVSNAKEQLTKELLDQLRAELKQKNLILVDQAYNLETVEFSVDKPEGTESPTLEATGVLRIKGLVFDEAQLRELIRTRLQAVVSSDESLQEAEKDSVSYRIKTVDLDTKVFGLIVHYESVAYGSVDLDSLKSEILGNSLDEAKSILLSHPEIDRVDFTISPVWQHSIPRFSRNVDLELGR